MFQSSKASTVSLLPIVDFGQPTNNRLTVCNQWTYRTGTVEKRFDVVSQASDELDLDLSCFLTGFSIFKNFLQPLSIHDKSLNVITHRLDVDVLVDQLNCFGAKSVPEEPTIAAWRLHRFIDLREPPVINFVRTEYRIGR